MRILLILSTFALLALAEDNTQLSQLLYDGNKQFTAKMFSEVVKSEPDKSVVLSAFSVLQPLAQLSLASAGDTHDQILSTIGLPNDNVTKQVFPLVNSGLRSIKGVELKMANKIYIPLDYQLNEGFNAVSRDVFGSEIKNVDFTKSVETANEINQWVEDQTNHRIKNLVSKESLNSDTRAVLVNALYFKGSWKEKFDKTLTTDRDFHVTKSNTIKVPTMFKSDNFRYGESTELNAKLLELPYEGEESSFLIVLPNEIDGLSALKEKLKEPSILSNAVNNMYFADVDVYLPKFKIETTTDLKDILQKMGITDLFDDRKADLSLLLKSKEQLYVSTATQKAFIEVNEEGAEAAAANEFGITYLTASVPEEHVVFDANHPFIFFLKEKNNVLFNGVYQS